MDASVSVGGLGPGEEQQRQQSKESPAAPRSTQLRHDCPHQDAPARKPGAASRWGLAIRCRKTLAAQACWRPASSGAATRGGSVRCPSPRKSLLGPSRCGHCLLSARLQAALHTPLSLRQHPETRPRPRAASHLPGSGDASANGGRSEAAGRWQLNRGLGTPGGAGRTGRRRRGRAPEAASPPSAHLGPPGQAGKRRGLRWPRPSRTRRGAGAGGL